MTDPVRPVAPREDELTNREREVLHELTDAWSRPMDIGGRDSSDHARVLASLARKGFVERRRRNTLANDRGSNRGSYVYRNPSYARLEPKKTNADRLLEFTRILASYECAGVDQSPDDPTLCGKCGPCEAGAFLRKIGKR